MVTNKQLEDRLTVAYRHINIAKQLVEKGHPRAADERVEAALGVLDTYMEGRVEQLQEGGHAEDV